MYIYLSSPSNITFSSQAQLPSFDLRKATWHSASPRYPICMEGGLRIMLEAGSCTVATLQNFGKSYVELLPRHELVAI